MAKAAQHKESLIHTAMRLFRQQGYASTGLQQILKESGAPKGSLYHYFPSGKEALAESAVELAGQLIAKMLSEHADSYPDNAEAFVKAYCKTMAGWMAESGFQSGCPIATTMLETAPQCESLTQAGSQAMDRWIRIIQEVFFNSGIAKPVAKIKAEQLISNMEGALIIARIRSSEKPIMDISKHFFA